MNIDKGYNFFIDPIDSYQFEETGNYPIEIKFNENLTSLDFIFEDCVSLKEIDLSNLKTSFLNSMKNVFDGCLL